MRPQPLQQLGVGLAVSVTASLVNLVVARVILAASRRFESVTLAANAHHLFTDVSTSAAWSRRSEGALTGWQRLDPVIALLVAGNIVWTGGRIVREAVLGLLDTALPVGERDAVRGGRTPPAGRRPGFAMRTRQSGAQRFVSLHVLVPGAWTVHQGHELLERLEREIREVIPNVTVFTHLEAIEDPSSWDNQTPRQRGHGSRRPLTVDRSGGGQRRTMTA